MFKKKYPIVLQNSEEDCGAACLASIAKFYGKNLTIGQSREAVGTGQLGTTLLGLRRGAESLGFFSRSGQATPELLDNLDQITLPAIIHWKGYHWVLFYGRKGKKYIIADPAVGVRYISIQELTESWFNGVMLLLQPDESKFYRQKEESNNDWQKFLHRITPYRSIIIQAAIYAQLIGILSLIEPFLVQIITDDVLIRGDTQLLRNLCLGVILLLSFQVCLGYIVSHLVTNFVEKIELSLVLEFAQKILRLPLKYYETRRSGEIISRLEDISEINFLVSQVAIGLPSQIFIAISSFLLMCFYSVKLTLLSISITIAMSVSTFVFLPILQQKVRRLLVLGAENQGVLVEIFKGATTLKTTGAELQFWDELQSRFGALANQRYSTTHIGIINSQFSSLVSGVGGILILWLGSSFVIAQDISLGQLLAFNSMNGNFVGFIGFTIAFVDEYAKAKTAIERLSEVTEHPLERKGDCTKPSVKIPTNADISFKQINFYYPGRLELLKDFSLNIPGGVTTCLIGKSGCGKSTLVKLLASLYQIQSGSICVGTYDLQDISLDSLRQQIVLVPQEAHFWSRSIMANFQLGMPHISFERVVEACQITLADEFIRKLPDKYQTVLGEFGSNLSGGQKQRLALARAIAANPPILILDESTSGLDPISEAEVMRRLLYHRRGKTTILIGHRPSIIRLADWVLMLEEGQLKIQGIPEDLAQKSGSHLAFLG